MMALEPMRFPGGPSLSQTAMEMAREAHRQPPAEAGSEVLVPGDPEYRTQRIRAVQGIPLEPELVQELGLEGIARCTPT